MTDRLLISQGEACQRLGVSRLTLIREIEAGRLRYVLVGKKRRFSPSELEAYVGLDPEGGKERPRG
jgi:excisionase family DNA binding protein